MWGVAENNSLAPIELRRVVALPEPSPGVGPWLMLPQRTRMVGVGVHEGRLPAVVAPGGLVELVCLVEPTTSWVQRHGLGVETSDGAVVLASRPELRRLRSAVQLQRSKS